MKSDIKIRRIDWVLPRVSIAAIIFYYYKTAFWPLTYLFVISFIILLVVLLIKGIKLLKFKEFFIDLFPPLTLAAIYFLIIIINNQLSNKILQKDLFLIAVLFTLIYFVYLIVVIYKYQIPKTFTVNLIVFTSLFISILNILKFVFGSRLDPQLLLSLKVSEGNTLATDYNFYCIFILFGLVIANSRTLFSPFGGVYAKVTLLCINFLFVANILISGSKRGIIVLFALATVFLIRKLLNVKKIFDLKKFIRSIVVFISTTFLLLCLFILILPIIPKEKVSIMIFRYSSFIGISDFALIHTTLWEPKNEISKKSESLFNFNEIKIEHNQIKSLGDNTKISKITTPFGKGVKINDLKNGLEGSGVYCHLPAIIYFANHTYNISFKLKINQNDLNSVKVGWLCDDGCWGNTFTIASNSSIISEGGDWYSFSSDYTFIDNHVGIIMFIKPDARTSDVLLTELEITDLDHNPAFPKFPNNIISKEDMVVWINKFNPAVINTQNLINNGDFKSGLDFWKQSADSLTIKIVTIDNKECAYIIRGDGDNESWTLYYKGRNVPFYINNEYQISFKIKPVIPKTIPFYVGYWVNEGNGYMINLPLRVEKLKDGWLDVNANYTFKNNQTNLVFPFNSQIDNSQFYITDISLVNLTQVQHQKDMSTPVSKMNIIEHQDDESNFIETILSGRAARWEYAYELWKSEYKWYNKFVGHGLDYLKWFAQKYKMASTAGDYPHNPVISILMYSGILGLGLYVWLLIRVILKYISLRKTYGVFFIGFSITYFFSFFSGTHPFDPPIMGFFILIPFLLYRIEKNKLNKL